MKYNKMTNDLKKKLKLKIFFKYFYFTGILYSIVFYIMFIDDTFIAKMSIDCAFSPPYAHFLFNNINKAE